MNTSNDKYAVSALYTWFKKNREYFIQAKMNIEFKDSGRSSACVNLECDSHLMQLCAWDHASCLDIEILDTATENTKILHVGECGSLDEFENELNKFLIWHKRELATI